MFKKDLLIQQLEEFGKMLALLLSHKREGNFEKFEQEMDLAFEKYARLPLAKAEAMTEHEFETEILLNTALDFSQKKILAALLFEKMNYYTEIAEHEKSASLRKKCLGLYEHIQSNSTVNDYDLDVHYKLDSLKKSGEDLN